MSVSYKITKKSSKKNIICHTILAFSSEFCSVSWRRGCVDLECGMTNDVSQLSEFSGNNLSTEDVDPAALVAIDIV